MVELSVKVEIIEKEDVQIYRMATLDLQKNPILWVSAYLIDGLLIDCGHQHAKNEFIKRLDIDSVEKVILSHHHEDHVGACYDLIRKSNLPIYANKETCFLLLPTIAIPPERMLTWGVHRPFKATPLNNHTRIKTTTASFKIIDSPGHCFNLISLFHKKKRLLFSTDAFINEKQNVIFNWENAIVMMDTFRKFIKLKPRYIFLEDGRVITTSELQELLDYWSYLKQESTKLRIQGLNPRKIVKKIFGKESWLKTATGGDMSRENLIRSLLELRPLFKRKIRKK